MVDIVHNTQVHIDLHDDRPDDAARQKMSEPASTAQPLVRLEGASPATGS